MGLKMRLPKKEIMIFLVHIFMSSKIAFILNVESSFGYVYLAPLSSTVPSNLILIATLTQSIGHSTI